MMFSVNNIFVQLLSLIIYCTLPPRNALQKDACTAQWNDLKLAFRAKLNSDPEEARKMIAMTHYKRNLEATSKVRQLQVSSGS